MKFVLILVVLASIIPRPAVAQVGEPRERTFAIGGDVGFLAPDNGPSDQMRPLHSAGGNVDAFFEYYYTASASLRVMYGWATPQFESRPGRSLRRQHLNLNFIYNWPIGRFRPFATIGGGTYFLRQRQDGDLVGAAVAKPGGSLGWGGEFHFRTFAVKSEMNVHILNEEKSLPELDGQTLTAFTWTFGIKVPF